jgi:small conductance mechanosensitive channel
MVAKDHPIEIFGQEFGNSSINFEVTWWTRSTPLEVRRSRDEVVRAVKKALDTQGISIPFPHRTLTFKDDTLLEGIAGKTDETRRPNSSAAE